MALKNTQIACKAFSLSVSVRVLLAETGIGTTEWVRNVYTHPV